MENEWELLHDFTSYEQAHFVLQTLESKGIPAMLNGEYSAKFVNYFRTHGGHQLYVKRDNYEEAVVVFKEITNYQESNSTLDFLEDQLKWFPIPGMNVVYKVLLIGLFISLILVYFLNLRTQY